MTVPKGLFEFYSCKIIAYHLSMDVSIWLVLSLDDRLRGSLVMKEWDCHPSNVDHDLSKPE